MIAGRAVFICLFCNNLPGEGNLLSFGVALSCSKAKEWYVTSLLVGSLNPYFAAKSWYSASELLIIVTDDLLRNTEL